MTHRWHVVTHFLHDGTRFLHVTTHFKHNMTHRKTSQTLHRGVLRGRGSVWNYMDLIRIFIWIIYWIYPVDNVSKTVFYIAIYYQWLNSVCTLERDPLTRLTGLSNPSPVQKQVLNKLTVCALGQHFLVH